MLTNDVPVLALDDLTDDKARLAQDLLLKDERLAKTLHVIDQSNNEKQSLRNEVMQVKPALPGDRVGAVSVRAIGQCYRMDIYNFFFNVTVTGGVLQIGETWTYETTYEPTADDIIAGADLSQRVWRCHYWIGRLRCGHMYPGL